MNTLKILKISIFILCLVIIILLISAYLYRNIVKKSFNTKINIIKNYMDEIENILNKNNIDIPFFYINLKRSPERKKFMEDQLNRYNVGSYTRVDAIDSKLLEFKNTPTSVLVKTACCDSLICNCEKVTCINNYNRLTNNEVACTLSHLKAIYIAYNMNYEKVVIVEDDADISLSKLWDYKLSEICDRAPEDWEIIQLYNNCSPRSSNMFIPYNFKEECWGAVAYIINRKGMKAILDHSLYPNVILGYKKNTDKDNIIKGRDMNMFPHMGVADSYLYEIANTYVLNKSIIFPNNYTNNMTSTLGTTLDTSNIRDNYAMKSSNEIISSFIDKIRSHTEKVKSHS